MRSDWRWLLPRLLLSSLLFSSGSQGERDPFQQPAAIRCLNARPVARLWRLYGIVGRADDYRAWLVSPQGKGKLWAPPQWLAEDWQLLKVEALSITVGSGQGCKTPLRIMLKGSLYVRDAKDDRTVSAVAPHAVIRQPASTVSGIR